MGPEVEHGRLELDALSTQAEQEGGDVGGIANALARLERASDPATPSASSSSRSRPNPPSCPQTVEPSTKGIVSAVF
jgi:hypothetical protein